MIHGKKAFDVVALGELLIDFTQNGPSGQGNPLFEANPGGAPCNVWPRAWKTGLPKACGRCCGSQTRLPVL